MVTRSSRAGPSTAGCAGETDDRGRGREVRVKRWPIAVILFLLLAFPALAEAPAGAPKRVLDSTLPLHCLPFPTIKQTTVTQHVNPHVRMRIDVRGDEWQFALVQMRGGWEIDTVVTQEKSVRALLYASLDYLAGERDALDIFATVDPTYLLLLDDLASRR
jgi:hypothetical protein